MGWNYSRHLITFLCYGFFSKMRKEADDIGPTAELEHWKERMAKFNVYVILTQVTLDINYENIYIHIKWHLMF